MKNPDGNFVYFQEAIFQLVVAETAHLGEVGSGFVIANDGENILGLTSKHTLEKLIERAKQSTSKGRLAAQLSHLWADVADDPIEDTKIPDNALAMFALKEVSIVGIDFMGMPEAKVSTNGAPAFSVQFSFYIGHGEVVENIGTRVKGPIFCSNLTFKHGMSGSPIFDRGVSKINARTEVPTVCGIATAQLDGSPAVSLAIMAAFCLPISDDGTVTVLDWIHQGKIKTHGSHPSDWSKNDDGSLSFLPPMPIFNTDYPEVLVITNIALFLNQDIENVTRDSSGEPLEFKTMWYAEIHYCVGVSLPKEDFECATHAS